MKWFITLSSLILSVGSFAFVIFVIGTSPNPDTYVTMVKHVSKECSGKDTGKSWYNSLPNDQARLQGAMACAAYWTGRKDQSVSDLTMIKQELNSPGS